MTTKPIKKKALPSKRRGAKRKRPVYRPASTRAFHPAKPLAIPPAMDEYGYLTGREVIGILRISASTLRNMMQSKALPYLRLGRKSLFRKTDLDAFIKARTIK